MHWFFALFLLFSLSTIHAIENINFFQLNRENALIWNKQEVSIRGFLYRINDQLILAAEPNLKSCCMASSEKIQQQLIVFGLPQETSIKTAAVKLSGTFSIDSNGRYILENTQN